MHIVSMLYHKQMQKHMMGWSVGIEDHLRMGRMIYRRMTRLLTSLLARVTL